MLKLLSLIFVSSERALKRSFQGDTAGLKQPLKICLLSNPIQRLNVFSSASAMSFIAATKPFSLATDFTHET